MIHLVGPEHGRLPYALFGDGRDASSPLAERLRRFDDAFERSHGARVFDWNDRRFVRASNWVGVLQVAGLVIEILPKTDADDREFQAVERGAHPPFGTVRRNLLRMLHVAREVPLREWERADLHESRASLLEVLIAGFVGQLLGELRRGVDHAYVTREESLGVVKGRIVFPRQVRENAARPHRTVVRYDEFLADTALNRLLRCACTHLLRLTRVVLTQERLKEALHAFADVGDASPREALARPLTFHRNNERFRALAGFARMVLEGLSPNATAGATPWISLLTPMEKLFEAFIGALMRRHQEALFPEGAVVRLQARGDRRWVLRDDAGSPRFQLKPDVLVQSGDQTILVLDTKWKRLPTQRDAMLENVATADLYQLFTYAKRYESRLNVLVYPAPVPGVTAPLGLAIEGPAGELVVITFVDLSTELRLVNGEDVVRWLFDPPGKEPSSPLCELRSQ